jgi:hypothetical protein
MNSSTPKLDAALKKLAETLRRTDAEICAAALNRSGTLESRLRASVFRARIRNTLLELERPKC